MRQQSLTALMGSVAEGGGGQQAGHTGLLDALSS